jgi:hypothetical protein
VNILQARPKSTDELLADLERLPNRWRFEKIERGQHDYFAWAYRQSGPGTGSGISGAGKTVREAILALVRRCDRELDS